MFSSFFRTDIGGAVSLPRCQRIGFRAGPDASIDVVAGVSQTPTYYVAPAGKFQVAASGTSNALLCGLSGTESITLSGGDVINFYPGQPAYAPVFPLQTVDLTQTGPPPVGDLLHSDYTTSWATISSAGGNAYQSQPPSGAMYHYGKTPGDSARPALEFFVTTAATLGADAVANAFPMAPYTGAPVGAHPFARFEAEIVGPRRHAAIASAPAKAPRKAAAAGPPDGDDAAGPAGDGRRRLVTNAPTRAEQRRHAVRRSIRAQDRAAGQSAVLVITQWPAGFGATFANGSRSTAGRLS